MIALSLISSLRRAIRLIDNRAPMITVVRQLNAIHRHIEDWFNMYGLQIGADYEQIPLPTELRHRAFFLTSPDRMQPSQSKFNRPVQPEGAVPDAERKTGTVHRLHTDREIQELVRAATARFDALTPAQQAEHREEQKKSFVRGMTARCEHGQLDFEQCPDCRARAWIIMELKRDDPDITEEEITELLKEAGVS